MAKVIPYYMQAQPLFMPFTFLIHLKGGDRINYLVLVWDYDRLYLDALTKLPEINGLML